MNKSVDIRETLNSVLGDLMASQIVGFEPETNILELSRCIDVINDLIESAHEMSVVINRNSEREDGCFYYYGLSSPELDRPISAINRALSRVRGQA